MGISTSKWRNMAEGISKNYLDGFKSKGYSWEYILNHILAKYGVLLHGSRVDISDDYIRPNIEGNVFAADLASIAILKAIFSNKGLINPGLQYGWFINEKKPLILKIHGIQEYTIGSEGFIYIIPNRNGFRNEPEGSWQYVKKRTNVPYSLKIKVLREDFKYPIFDVTNNRWIAR